MRKQEIYWQIGQPDEAVKEPILIKMNGSFKWGLQYKLPESSEKPKKVWKLTSDIIEWAEIV